MNNKQKGKPITTSVPTFAIRFHASGEELEELYPSEEEDKSLTEEKCTESTASEPTKQESSPMRDYLNKFGKRSSSIDGGINDTSQQTSTDPWRIFSNFTEFKGKLTKTVEEKLSEIKSKSSDAENSPKFDKNKTSSKDNSSISDCEENSVSECSIPRSTGLSSTAEDLEMSSEDECSVENDKTPTSSPKMLTGTPELRQRKNTIQISYKKEQEEIQLTTMTDRDRKDSTETQEEIESGIEAFEEYLKMERELNFVETVSAPKGFVDRRTRKRIIKKSYRLYKILVLILIVVLLYCYPVFMIGFSFGAIVTGLLCLVYFNLFNETDKDDYIFEKTEETVPILEIPAVKEHQPVTKFEGWVNEYPEVYNPYTYHIQYTQSIYLKLESNILRISHTTSKIPKRAMWNEPKHNVNFTYHRIYNLKGAEVVLLPRGLIHKRIWSKKYPICIILNKEFMHTDLPNKRFEKEESVLEDLSKKDKTRKDSEKEQSENSVCREEDDKTEVDDYRDVFEKDEEDDKSITEDWDTLLDENSQETKLYFFGRTGRDKEDWYRRLVLASRNPQDIKIEIKAEAEEDVSVSSELDTSVKSENLESESQKKEEIKDEEEDYLEYMARLGQVKRETISELTNQHIKKGRSFFRKKKDKQKNIEDEADGDKEKEDKIDDIEEHQWFNIIIGRILFDMNKNEAVITNMQERIQKKLSTIKLPYFIEEIVISQLNLGKASPRVLKIYPSFLDERGLWIDMDVTYEGIIKMSLTTKLNLMKLKEQAGRSDDAIRPTSPNSDDNRSPMFHSDIEDSAESSSDDEGIYVAPSEKSETEKEVRDAKGKKFLRMIDNIASSSLFQQATENKYIKRAMEGVSRTELKLSVEIRSLEGTLSVNISAPPSDRIWLGFRGNPKLQLCAKPAFGERSINFAHVTRWIEKKLSQEFQKFLVMPNMEDFVCPVMNPNLPK